MNDQERYQRGGIASPASHSQPIPPIERPHVDSAARESASTQQSAADQAQDKAQEVMGQAHDQAQQVAGMVREQVEQRSSQAAEQISQQASDLRTVSQSLREQGKDGPAKAADRLAAYAERAGGYLDGKSAEQLLRDAEDLGRRRPWVAAGAGVALGLAASRLLKASSRERYATRPNGPAAPASSLPGTDSRVASSRLAGSSPVDVPTGVPPLGSSFAPAPGPTPGF